MADRSPQQPVVPVHRGPADMESWEIIAAYRHAHALASYNPNARLAKELANWKLHAQGELERRGQWNAAYLLDA